MKTIAGVPPFLIGVLAGTVLMLGALIISLNNIQQNKDVNEAQNISNAESTKASVIQPRVGATADDRVADYTWWLAAFTGLLSFVSAFQGWMLVRADNTARTSADAAKKSIDLAREEFIATHRPRIAVQSVQIQITKERDRGYIEFTLVNGGESKATVTGFVAWPYVKTDGAAFMPGLTEPEMRQPNKTLILAPGERVFVVEPRLAVALDYDAFLSRSGRLFAIGNIQYCGPDNITRITGFCREYSREDGVWRRVPDSSDEYAY